MDKEEVGSEEEVPIHSPSVARSCIEDVSLLTTSQPHMRCIGIFFWHVSPHMVLVLLLAFDHSTCTLWNRV